MIVGTVKIDKADFKENNKIYFIMREVLTYGKNISILNVYVPNNKAWKYKKPMSELQREINNSTVIFSGFNIFSQKWIQQIEKHEIKKTWTILIPNLSNSYRTLCPATMEKKKKNLSSTYNHLLR